MRHIISSIEKSTHLTLAGAAHAQHKVGYAFQRQHLFFINSRALECDLRPSTVATAIKRRRDLSRNNKKKKKKKKNYQKSVLQDTLHPSPQFSPTLNIH